MQMSVRRRFSPTMQETEITKDPANFKLELSSQANFNFQTCLNVIQQKALKETLLSLLELGVFTWTTVTVSSLLKSFFIYMAKKYKIYQLLSFASQKKDVLACVMIYKRGCGFDRVLNQYNINIY